MYFITSNIVSYPSPKNINMFWNFGFLVGLVMTINIVSGFLLGLHYVPNCDSAYYSVVYIMRELYFGWLFRYVHSNGVSVGYIFLVFHICRAIIYGSYFYSTNTWFTGIFIYIFLIVISFIGYILPWGSMSYWGATVITNLLEGIPCLVLWICGNFHISSPTLNRFFIFHFLLAIVMYGILVFHIMYLHKVSSISSLGYNTNNKIQFFPFIFYKDVFVLFIWLFLFILGQIYFGFLTLSHHDNVFEVDIVLTPPHIIPEWYFLHFYMLLKIIPNKITGFVVMFYFILVMNIYGESHYLNCKLQIQSPVFYENLYAYFIVLLLYFYYLWVGVQHPQDNFLSYPLFSILLTFALLI